MKVGKVGEMNDKYEILGMVGVTAAELLLTLPEPDEPRKTVNATLVFGGKKTRMPLTIPVYISEFVLDSQLSQPTALNSREQFTFQGNEYTGLFMFRNQIYLANAGYLENASEQKAALQDDKGLGRLEREVAQLENSENPIGTTRAAILRGESETLEFKSAACWNSYTKLRDEAMIKNVIETVAAFMNSRRGGTLLIGISDNGVLLDLSDDYAAADKTKRNRDGYELFIRNALNNNLGADCISFYNIRFEEIDGKSICRIDVSR